MYVFRKWEGNMRGLSAVRALVALSACIASAFFLAGSASAQAQFGVSVLKDCVTPINVGDPYSCEFEISNTVQASHNTVTVKSLADTVFRSGGTASLTLPINSSTPGLILS